MTPTLQEAIMLLKKWLAESTPLVIITCHRGPDSGQRPIHSPVIQLLGTVESIEETTAAFVLTIGTSGSILAAIEDCAIGFEASITDDKYTDLVPQEFWDSMILFKFPDGMLLSLYALKRAVSAEDMSVWSE
jgi:hypothetical protein